MSQIYQKLAVLQQELKVNKGIWNKFGEFYYRSCENILESLKPFLKDLGLLIILDDEVVQIGDRVYMKSTARLIDPENNEACESHAYAREPESKPKMDVSQVTGSASSYARKYALGGLLALDDAKDPDTDAYVMMSDDTPEPPKDKGDLDEKGAQLQAHVEELAKAKKITRKKALDIARRHGAGSFTTLASVEQFENIMKEIDASVK